LLITYIRHSLYIYNKLYSFDQYVKQNVNLQHSILRLHCVQKGVIRPITRAQRVTRCTCVAVQVWFQNRRSKERRMKQLSALGARRHAFFRSPRRMRTLVDRLEPGELIPNGPFSYYGGECPETVIMPRSSYILSLVLQKEKHHTGRQRNKQTSTHLNRLPDGLINGPLGWQTDRQTVSKKRLFNVYAVWRKSANLLITIGVDKAIKQLKSEMLAIVYCWFYFQRMTWALKPY